METQMKEATLKSTKIIRFFGLMPCTEVEKEAHYIDCRDRPVRIQAGPHGWTVVYADCSTNYKDIDADTETNFNEALRVATDNLGILVQYNYDNNGEKINDTRRI